MNVYAVRASQHDMKNIALLNFILHFPDNVQKELF